MARYVSTKSASGGSSGGGAAAGLSASDVCNQICKLSTDAAGTPGSTVASDLTSQASEISGGYSQWKMICNCPCWTDCYGCNVVWCFDSTKYRGYKLVYSGMRLCACCYAYWCNGIGSVDCFCCCNNAYMGTCICCWPTKSCCCLDAYHCCNMLRSNCVYCCNTPYDDMWGFEWTVWSPCNAAWGCPKQGAGVMWDFSWKKFIRNNWADYHYASRDRQMGFTYCHCLYWSPCQNSSTSRYFARLLMRMENNPFMSALSSGNYESSVGGACAAGQPCWTIWGIPCHRPEFGTCCMDAS